MFLLQLKEPKNTRNRKKVRSFPRDWLWDWMADKETFCHMQLYAPIKLCITQICNLWWSKLPLTIEKIYPWENLSESPKYLDVFSRITFNSPFMLMDWKKDLNRNKKGRENGSVLLKMESYLFLVCFGRWCLASKSNIVVRPSVFEFTHL